MKVVFALGYSKLYEEIAREEYINNEDVIQFSFLDTYRNNTHKTIMSYDWVVSNCSSSTFVMFVDDDVYVNIPNILQFAHGTLNYMTTPCMEINSASPSLTEMKVRNGIYQMRSIHTPYIQHIF